MRMQAHTHACAYRSTHDTHPQGNHAPAPHTLQGSSGIQVVGMAGLPARLLSRAHEAAALLSQQLQRKQMQTSHLTRSSLDSLLSMEDEGRQVGAR